MIYGCTIFYNDGAALLRKCLEAQSACGLRTIAIDGAFNEFPVDETRGELRERSTDGCNEVAHACADVVVQGAWPTQVAKRNAYLQLVPNGSFLFVLDADEIINPCQLDEAALLADTYDIYRVIENRHDEDGLGTMWRSSSIRVYRKLPGLHYAEQHCRLYDGDGRLLVSAHHPDNALKPLLLKRNGNGYSNESEVSFEHLKHLRNKHRRESKELYYTARKEKELGYD